VTDAAAAYDRRTMEELVDVGPSWMRDAACREHPEVSWFPGAGDKGLKAKSICEGCLVVGACLEYAIEHGESGVWGGMDDRERLRFVAARTLAG
jgi:WhiB family transcriptional regulator, redox-sensing transcriptional regulator